MLKRLMKVLDSVPQPKRLITMVGKIVKITSEVNLGSVVISLMHLISPAAPHKGLIYSLPTEYTIIR